MKDLLVVIISLVAISVATILHRERKVTEQSDIAIENLEKSFRVVKEIVPESASISFRWYNADGVFLWSRYVLAPRHITENTEGRFDTTLTICGIHSTDSLLGS